jgi:hypothetical protein
MSELARPWLRGISKVKQNKTRFCDLTLASKNKEKR